MNNIAWGHNAFANATTQKCCIAIGDDAQCEKDYELVIKTSRFELRGIMTPEEHEVLYGLLARIIKNNSWPKEESAT